MPTKKILMTAGLCLVAATAWGRTAPAVDSLLERIDKGLSQKIVVEVDASDNALYGGNVVGDRFCIGAKDGRPLITATDDLSAAVGVNHYLKYYAGVHLCWGNMHADVGDDLPLPSASEAHSCSADLRYYLNYCTHSYSMAFWDWDRWQEEIDWMALHGINMPLAITGTETVWRNVLRRLDYPEAKINEFVAGPGFQAWWLMNNLEGWGGPVAPAYYERQKELQQRIVARMRSFGMEPVFAGYAGMLPHDAATTLGIDVQDPGQWFGYKRPAFLQPESADFARIAAIYYDELNKLYGTTRYYSMDPFHEGGSTKGVDLAEAGRAIMRAMKANNPEAVWVIQAWRKNPRLEMIGALDKGDLLVLDLHAETEPIWNGRGFAGHDWLWCMLHNFGGNIGLYGRLETMGADYRKALAETEAVRGIGLTMEGIETNPVVYEYMAELPWADSVPDLDQWLGDYAAARYGVRNDSVAQAWRLLGHSVYACPAGNRQQGTAESLFCARPSDNPRQASAWSKYTPYYDYAPVAEAARILTANADKFGGNANYIYDMVDVVRQVTADKGREVAARLSKAVKDGDKEAYRCESEKFLELIRLQDELLGTVADFRLGRWLDRALSLSEDPAERDNYNWNARVQITTWGNRQPSERGKLHDYAHREWQGLLLDYYLPRWQRWFAYRLDNWGMPADKVTSSAPDAFAAEYPWSLCSNPYSSTPQGDPIATARRVLPLVLAM